MENNETGDTARFSSIKIGSSLSFLLAAFVVLGLIFGNVREEGFYADDYLWMRYQTLLSPSDYTDYIWIPLFLLQGLFIYGSLFTFKNSPLVGYPFVSKELSSDNESANQRPMDLIRKRIVTFINCPILLYIALCASTIFMVYFFDCGFISSALIMALIGTFVCGKILILQLEVLAKADQGAAGNSTTGGVDDTHVINNQAGDDMSHVVRGSTSYPLSVPFLQEYISLRLPFELYLGYVICLVLLFFNTWLDNVNVSPKGLLITANTSIFSLLVIACCFLWRFKQGNGRHFYGLIVSIVWYLVGVAIELQAPTQPIYNQFSDTQILSTQILAALVSTVLSSMLVIRMMKTGIKRNVLSLMGTCHGNNEEAANEDVITTDYVPA